MSFDRVRCPDCQTWMLDSALFCPGCGRPRTQVVDRLTTTAERTGVPYGVLLERVRSGSLRLSSLPMTSDTRPVDTGRNGTLVLLVLAALVVSAVVWVAGGGWLVAAGVIVGLAVAYGKAPSRVDRAEERIRSLEARVAMLGAIDPAEVVAPVAVPVPQPQPAHETSEVPAPIVVDIVDERPEIVLASVIEDPSLILPAPAQAPESLSLSVADAIPANSPAAEAHRLAIPVATPPSTDESPDRVSELDQPRPAGSEWWSGDLEQLLSGRILAFVGGLAIMIGAVFFLSLAFSRGWIGPGPRVLIGVGVSALMVGGGAWFFERRERVLGHVLVAVGLGIMSVSMLAATVLYDLIPSAAGLTGTLIAAMVAAAIAVRANSQVVALFGLVAALAAPPIQDAPVVGTTVLFLSLVLCGTTAIALYRSWSWLPPVAFLLTAPQLGAWIVDDAPIAAGLLALSGFWLLNAIAAGGEEYRLRDANRALRPVSATLLLANVAFLVACGFSLISPESEGGRGLFLAGVALAHAPIAGWFLRTEGDRHPFGLLAAGTGLAAFSIAIPVWLGGPVVPVAWAAEAVALTWVATRRQHTFSAVVAALLGLGATAHLGLFVYPLWRIFDRDVTERPFLNASGGTLIFILGAMAVAGIIARRRELRLVLGGVGFALLIYAMPFEFSGIPLLAAWSLLFVLAWAADQRLDRLPDFLEGDGDNTRRDRMLGRLLVIPTAVGGSLAVMHALVFELPLVDLDGWMQPETPFWTEQGAAAGILVAASLAFAAISQRTVERHAGIVAAFVVAAWLMPFELEPVPMLLSWSVLALAMFGLSKVMPGGLRLFTASGATLVGISFLTAVGTSITPSSFLSNNGRPFWSEAAVVFVALALTLGIAFWLHRAVRESRMFAIGAVGILAWLIPVELQEAGSVVGWSLLAALLMLLDHWPMRQQDVSRDLAQLFTVLILGFAALTNLVLVVPPSRLFVDEGQGINHPFFWSSATATLGTLAAVLAFAARLYRSGRPARWAAILCGVALVYLFSVGTVDIFQSRVGGQVAVESLQKQAQVALSILWTVLGVGLFVSGIIQRTRTLRIGGLALLGLSTVKVFVYDLASLDASYRVLSFIGLGILLLISSWAYQRAITPEVRPPGDTTSTPT